MFDEHLDRVIPAVIQCSKFTETTGKWAESRRDALGALASICLTVSRSKNLEPETLPVEQIYDCFLEGLTDYTICSRADIGACVREAAMSGLQVCTKKIR
ncbi:tubulin-specific chaperone D-like [Zootermopsis nevadensis]|uniref:Tubulin-specific chaperone D n=1 Tax=Zootermopsis nevadensis TaxID=136037 RepID=A0A067RBG9_ZOONE|nr:tubulin-specific chaperone D-like [Zootermopsis nevadensis]KDR20192.1 Tubulin-specific chaperone D [Zootermopsis nevadensis]